MDRSDVLYLLLKRFFNYYRLPLSVINKNGETLACFPSEDVSYILPPELMREEIKQYHNSGLSEGIPFLAHAPYDSFIAIVPLPNQDYLFIGPAFSRPFSLMRISHLSNDVLTRKELLQIQEITRRLPLVDEAFLSDALSLLVLFIHSRDVSADEILYANNMTYREKTIFNSSHIIEDEYEALLLFESQVQDFIREGKTIALTHLWRNFSASVKEDYKEYLYTEHHLMIPLLSSARLAALAGGATKEEVVTIFHTAISQISSRGSLSVNLKTVERATLDLCNLVQKNKSIPFRTDLCIKCEQYIDTHIAEKITASDLAEHCGIDRSLVFDIFQNNYNISLTEYIQNERMRRAKIMLIHSSIPVSEIASSLGYCSSSYFSKVFYEHFQCKPMKYRAIDR